MMANGAGGEPRRRDGPGDVMARFAGWSEGRLRGAGNDRFALAK